MSRHLKSILQDIQLALTDKNHIIQSNTIEYILSNLRSGTNTKIILSHKLNLENKILKLLEVSANLNNDFYGQLILEESIGPENSLHYSALDILIRGKTITLVYADHYDSGYRNDPIFEKIRLNLTNNGHIVEFFQIGGASYQYDESNCMFFAIQHLNNSLTCNNFYSLIKKYANKHGHVSWHVLPTVFLKHAQGLPFFCRYLNFHGSPGPKETEKWSSKNISLLKDIFPNLPEDKQNLFCFILTIIQNAKPVETYNRTKIRNQAILKTRQKLLTMAKESITLELSDIPVPKENLPPNLL